MELEELKLKWKVLSERLDREQVIRRQDMERMLRGRVGSYLHYVQLMLLLGVAVVPLCVAIGKFRGVSGIFHLVGRGGLPFMSAPFVLFPVVAAAGVALRCRYRRV